MGVKSINPFQGVKSNYSPVTILLPFKGGCAGIVYFMSNLMHCFRVCAISFSIVLTSWGKESCLPWFIVIE